MPVVIEEVEVQVGTPPTSARTVPFAPEPKKEEVAIAVGTPEPLELFARTEFAAIEARPMVWPAPRVVKVPVRPLLIVAEVVATLDTFPAPLLITSWPAVRFEEVAMP